MAIYYLLYNAVKTNSLGRIGYASIDELWTMPESARLEILNHVAAFQSFHPLTPKKKQDWKYSFSRLALQKFIWSLD